MYGNEKRHFLVAYYLTKGGNIVKKKLLAAVFGAVLLLGACGGGDKGNEADKGATDGDVAVDAEAVVQKSCVTCHGGNLEGASAPALDKIGATMSEDEIKDVIVNGQGGMPPGIIKDEAEVQAVAEWLAAKK